MRLGIFGGSFDPPHNYHSHIIKTSLSSLELDKLLVIPAGIQPLKTGGPKAPGHMRLKMLRSFIDDPRVTVSSDEILRGSVSYTVETLRSLEGKGDLYLIIGADSAWELEKWRDYREIMERARIAVFPRKGYGFSGLKEKWGDRIRLLPAVTDDVSSSRIRMMIERGDDCSRLMPGEVWSIITREGLYGWIKK